eukprot:CCRYP_006645-RA/>CCRYP_006645-RA protein AED:0.04 eAED:0.04 QI:63/1/1/1/1/1/2/313/416
MHQNVSKNSASFSTIFITLYLFSTTIDTASSFAPRHQTTAPPPTITMADSNDTATSHQRAKSAFKYVEDVAPGLKLEMDLHTIHHTSISQYQQVQVIDSYFGRTLVTDGKTQSAEHDEFVYHESLVHPALFWSALLSGNGGPKSVFIGGGGELATAREVLRHTSVERCVMVDIDPVVVEVCTKYLPEWGGQAVLSHPKMTYIVGDAHQYLMETTETFDVIIMDISDPVEAGPGIALYTQEFYRRAAELLSKECGVFVTQAGSADFVPHPHAFPEGNGGEEEERETCCFSPIKNTLATVFDHAIPYSCPVASFGEDWGFVLAFNGPSSKARELTDLPPETIDSLITERIRLVPGVPVHRYRSKGVKRATMGNEEGGEVLKHYDGVSHRRLFALSKPLREAMKSDERIMTVANPIFMY